MEDIEETDVATAKRKVERFARICSEHPEKMKLEIENLRTNKVIPVRFVQQLVEAVEEKINIHSTAERAVVRRKCLIEIATMLRFVNEVLQSDLARSFFRSVRLRYSLDRLYQLIKKFKRPRKPLKELRSLGCSKLLGESHYLRISICILG